MLDSNAAAGSRDDVSGAVSMGLDHRDDAEVLSAIIATQQAIADANLNLVEVAQVACARVLDLIDADGIAVAVSDGEYLQYQAAGGTAAHYDGLRVPIDRALMGECCRSHETVHVEDAEQDLRAEVREMAERGTRSIIGLPLLRHQRLVGLLVAHSRNRNAFGDQARSTLQLIAGTLGPVLDHAREKEAQLALMHERTVSEQRYRALLYASPDPILFVTPAGQIAMANRAATLLYGIASGVALEDRWFAELVPEEFWARIHQDAPNAISGEGAEACETRFLKANGSSVPVKVRLAPMLDDRGGIEGTIILMQDITADLLVKQALEYQALHDQLTGLPNRTLLYDRIHQLARTASRENSIFAVLALDLDGFKEVNDTFGHHHGDVLLQQVAGRLKAQLRASDTVARLGGDEFAVLLPDTDREGAHQAAAKLHEACFDVYTVESVEVHVPASVGVSVYGEDGVDAGALMRHADLKMYGVKRTRARPARYARSI